MSNSQRWKQQFGLAEASSLDAETFSPFYKQRDNPESEHLRQLSKSDDCPHILWNTQPAPHVNLLHSIYLEKLRQLQQEFDCNITILVFDRYRLESEQYDEETRAIQELEKQFIPELRSWGLQDEKTEILMETDIRFCIDSNELVEAMVHLSRTCDYEVESLGSLLSEQNGDITMEKMKESVAENIGNEIEKFILKTIEVYYEKIIDCDIVLTGKRDLEGVWQLLKSNDTGDAEYEEPYVLAFPELRVDGTDLTAERTRFIDKSMDRGEIKEELQKSQSLRELVFEHLVLGCQQTVTVDGETVATYRQLPKDRNRETEVLLDEVVHIFSNTV